MYMVVIQDNLVTLHSTADMNGLVDNEDDRDRGIWKKMHARMTKHLQSLFHPDILMGIWKKKDLYFKQKTRWYFCCYRLWHYFCLYLRYLTRNTVGFLKTSLQHLKTVPRATRPDTRTTVVLMSYWNTVVTNIKD